MFTFISLSYANFHNMCHVYIRYLFGLARDIIIRLAGLVVFMKLQIW